jgi:adenylate kinase family enzyme
VGVLNGPSHSAILLLGPTGSGKTPLGEYLESRGIAGARCVHFDFGVCLRSAAEGRGEGELSDRDREIIRESLGTGRLLSDQEFPIAGRIFSAFLRRRKVRASDTIVLNGLPRHVQQARAMDGMVQIRLVVFLECPADVVSARIRRDTGGDRSGRVDDAVEAVDRRLALFRKETLPLLDYYEAKRVRVATIRTQVDTTAADVAGQIDID